MKRYFKFFQYNYTILTAILCLGSLVVFIMSMVIDKYDPNWLFVFSFLSASFSSEIKTLFYSNSTGLWEIFLIGSICIIVLVKICLVLFLSWKNIKEPSIARCVIILVLVSIDLMMSLLWFLGDPQMRTVLVGCVIYRIMIIVSIILFINQIKRME